MNAPPALISSLDTRPDYAAALGVVCSEWANLEWQMFHLYASVSGSPPALARATFGAIESNRGRREIILACCKVVISDNKKTSDIKKIFDTIGRLAARRNEAVHDLWCVADTPKREVMQLRLSEVDGTQCVTGIALNDIHRLSQDIRDHSGRINALRVDIAGTVKLSLERLRDHQGIALVFGAKGQPKGRKPKGFHAHARPQDRA